jgi:hypothetical protein
MTYTFRGVRRRATGQAAVVSLDGTVSGVQERGRGLKGHAVGTVQVDLQTGRVVQAHTVVEMTLKLSFRGEVVEGSGALETQLTRD